MGQNQLWAKFMQQDPWGGAEHGRGLGAPMALHRSPLPLRASVSLCVCNLLPTASHKVSCFGGDGMAPSLLH